MRFPVIVAWMAVSFVPFARTAAEDCQYPIKDADGGDRSLTLTTSQMLQAPVDRNSEFASVQAAHLDFRGQEPDKRYLAIDVTVPLFLETASEAEAASKNHSPTVPKDLPLMINFTDDTSVILTSWGMGVSRGSSPVAAPGKFGNDTEFFRISRRYKGGYIVDDEQRAELQAKPVKRLQMTTAQGDYDVIVSPDRSDRIQFVLSCI